MVIPLKVDPDLERRRRVRVVNPEIRRWLISIPKQQHGSRFPGSEFEGCFPKVDGGGLRVLRGFGHK